MLGNIIFLYLAENDLEDALKNAVIKVDSEEMELRPHEEVEA